MRAVVQRTSRAEVHVDGDTVGSIKRGFLILVGFTSSDDEAQLAWIARKIASLRVFEDADDKMNLSLADVGGQVLVVSQFTLYANVDKGRRPSFIEAAPPQRARELYEQFCARLEAEGLTIARGVFGAKMEVELINDGPVTIIIDSKKVRKEES